MVEEVYKALCAQLMSMQIAPGSRLPVDKLARFLGVSQSPVREALSRLEARGLVVKSHLIGYSATPQLDRGRLEELYELRLLLEPYAAGPTALLGSDAVIQGLEQVDAEMRRRRSEESGYSYGTFSSDDDTFHRMIARESGNSVVQDALSGLHTHMHLLRIAGHRRVNLGAGEEHAKIVTAIKRRDAAGAEAAMRDHIEQSRARFLLLTLQA